MSVTLERPPTAWATRPGWGILVDLTPRQVVQARQVKVHRRLVALALLLVLLLCVGVSLLAQASRSAAQGSYDDEQTRTVGLTTSVNQYADITAMQGVTTRVTGDLTTVLANDIDVVNLLARVNEALPPGVRVGDQSVLLTPPVDAAPAPVADPAADDAAADPATDTATDTATDPATDPATAAPTGALIGTLSLAGTADSIDDVTAFVSALNRLRGAVDVLPSSVSTSDTGATYTISANLTDELLTGRYQTEAP